MKALADWTQRGSVSEQHGAPLSLHDECIHVHDQLRIALLSGHGRHCRDQMGLCRVWGPASSPVTKDKAALASFVLFLAVPVEPLQGMLPVAD
jgi:hypothetical protein